MHTRTEYAAGAFYVAFIPALAANEWYADKRPLAALLAALLAVAILVLAAGVVQTAWRWWRAPRRFGPNASNHSSVRNV